MILYPFDIYGQVTSCQISLFDLYDTSIYMSIHVDGLRLTSKWYLSNYDLIIFLNFFKSVVDVQVNKILDFKKTVKTF